MKLDRVRESSMENLLARILENLTIVSAVIKVCENRIIYGADESLVIT